MTTRTAFDYFCDELAANPKARPDEAATLAWLEAELAENSAAWVLSDMIDVMVDWSGTSERDKVAESALRALTATEPQAVVWYTMADALRALVIADAERKVQVKRTVDGWLAPLRTSLEHYDAIGADRRALARGEKL